jgi:cyclopropane fatty-acyl-phospholipid synthase-like methyltransferase
MAMDVGTYYSNVPIAAWQQIIGEELHYHFGFFRGQEDLQTGLRQTVQNFYGFIPEGSRVLDIGCGWGGPANLLIAERRCIVKGLTIADAQVSYCRTLGLDVEHRDVEREALPMGYDVALLLEVLEHIRDKVSLLRRLRQSARRAVIAANCIAQATVARECFGQTVVLCTVGELQCALQEAGWRIVHLRQRRFESLRSLVHWKNNLQRVYGPTEPPGQLGQLRGLVTRALRDPIRWCVANPLVDVVADRA